MPREAGTSRVRYLGRQEPAGSDTLGGRLAELVMLGHR